MNSDLNNKLNTLASSDELQTLIRVLEDKADLHIVGGTLRDIFLDRDIKDIDLACLLKPEEVLAKLNSENIRVVETGVQHGTVLAVLNGATFEITTFRQPSARDDSRFSESILIDLEGRDFTINSLAYSLTTKQLLDPFFGRQDLESNLLRAVKDPKERFREDPLRIIRMLRFGPAEKRELDEDTLQAAKEIAPSLSQVSIERIRQELEHILLSENAGSTIEFMKDHEFLQYVLPELIPTIGFEQNEHHIHDVFEHTLWVLDRAPQDLTLRLAAIFHDIGKAYTLSVDDSGHRHFYSHETESESIAAKTLKRLRFSNEIIKTVSQIVRYHMRPLDCGPAGVRRLVRDLGPHFEKWQQFKLADSPPKIPIEEIKDLLTDFNRLVEQEKIRAQGNPVSQLTINGNDLIKLGFKEGQKIGTILKELHERVLDNPDLNDRDRLLNIVKTEYLKKVNC